MENLTKDDFLKLLRESGFKNKKEFANFIDVPYQSVNNWGNTIGYPKYIRAFMNALIDAKKYKDLVNGNNIIAENESLRKQIFSLEEQIREYEDERRKFQTFIDSLNFVKEYQNVV